MNLVSYLMKSRGPVNTMRRLPKIVGRFGVSSGRMERALNNYVDVTAKYSCTPTLAVTSVLLERHPEIFRRFQGAELAVHGYVHTDYKVLDAQTQAEHMEKSLAAFRSIGSSPRGFRCPYLRWNDASFAVARDFGLNWASNRALAWNVVPECEVKPASLAAYRKGLKLYGALDASSAMALPVMIGGVLDIPACLPDDEAMLDRLELGPLARTRLWIAALEAIHERGEVMAMILHHERVALCETSLEALLDHARKLTPAVWIATLGEISDWWMRRARVQLDVRQTYESYEVIGDIDDDMRLALRGVAGGEEWYGRWSIASSPRGLSMQQPPVLVVSPDSPPSLLAFLRDEGYMVRSSGEGLRLPSYSTFDETAKRELTQHIESSDAPLVRLWRWPNGARAALSVTGDVDAMSLVDFLKRPLEV